MQTIKLPYTTDKESYETIVKLQKEFSPIVRSAYSRFMDGISQLQVRQYLRSKFPGKDSWFLQSAVYEALGMATVDLNQKKTRIFGGKKNWLDRMSGKISGQKWKEARLLPVSTVGESVQHGNRKIAFDLANNAVIFKISRANHIKLQLPKLRKNYLKILTKLETLCKDRKTPVSVKISSTDICISFDETALAGAYKPIATRYAGIDLNPNYIGLVIYEEDELLLSRIYELTKLTGKSGKSSDSTESKYLSDKLNFELNEISKQIVDICAENKVNLLTTEALTIRAKDHGRSKANNRLINNRWPRAKVLASLKKWAGLAGIKYASVNPAYSSYIGNIVYPLPDPAAAASEMARRGYQLIIKKSKQFYPVTLPGIEYLRNLWKKDADWSLVFADWKELAALVKKSGLKYRIPIPMNGFKIFMSKRSRVTYRT